MTHILHRAIRATPEAVIDGDGLTLRLSDGRTIIDACGGAAVACLGHGNRRVADAIGRQAARVAYAHTGFFTSEPAEALADTLLGDAPGGLTHALFLSSGSEAMEAAIKLARQFFLETGQGQRSRVIARRQSYHGATLACLAVGGHAGRRARYEPILPTAVSHVSPCFPYHHQAPGEDDAAYVARLRVELDAEFERLGSDRVIAFVAETVVGATAGCVPPVPGYFAAVREVCDRHGALLILDEVMCGMGRTGTMHAWQAEGVAPDLETIGKGLGAGYQPIGAVLVAGRVVEGLAAGTGAIGHGQTYQAHPVACAAALEVQRIIAEDRLLGRVTETGAYLRAALERRFGDHPNVGDIRGRGLFQAIELVEDRAARRPFAPEKGTAERIKREALALGLAVYPGSGTMDGRHGDHVLLAPPYIALPADIDVIVDRLGQAVDRAVG